MKIFFIVTICVSFFCLVFLSPGKAQNPIIIEFGWDYPDVEQLHKKLDSIQNTPFDGICFSFQREIMEAFDTALKNRNYFNFEKIQKLRWGKYKSNYVIVRGSSRTGGNWFDDKAWENIVVNIENISKVLRAGGVDGVMFDPEYYHENPIYNPWTYDHNQYPSKKFEEVQQQVKKRGAQFIRALQKYKTGFNFLSIWLTSLIAEDLKVMPLEKTRHALLIAFFEGILEAKNKNTKITDGNEYAYWFTKPSQFLFSKDYLMQQNKILFKSSKAKAESQNIEIAQPIFYDGLMALHNRFDKQIANDDKWKWLKGNYENALLTSDRITWFYSERINWWSNPNINDTLTTILKTRKSLSIPNKNNPSFKIEQKTISRVGYFNAMNFKKPMQNMDSAFSFEYKVKNNLLTVNFFEETPLEIFVYTNNRRYTHLSNLKAIKKAMFVLPAKTKKIIIQTTYRGKREASGFVIL